MTPVRHLALWLAAAIVMIAVSLVPSAASAHAGHGHGAARVSATDGSAAKGGHPAPQMVKAQAAKAEARLLCAGPCCLPSAHACSSCCSAGLMPADELAWSAPNGSGPELARDVPSPSGIVPEALPEPPRPLA